MMMAHEISKSLFVNKSGTSNFDLWYVKLDTSCQTFKGFVDQSLIFIL